MKTQVTRFVALLSAAGMLLSVSGIARAEGRGCGSPGLPPPKSIIIVVPGGGVVTCEGGGVGSPGLPPPPPK